jgi:Holliday junction resolvase-like predicted endonuclease
MNNNSKQSTPESAWAAIERLSERIDKSQVNFDRRFDEMSRKMAARDARSDAREARIDAKLEKMFQKMNERDARSDAKWEKLHASIARLDQDTGGMGNSNGDFAEEFFHNSLKNGNMEFFGEKFDRVERNRLAGNRGRDGEYDQVLYNGKAICIVEVKYKAQEKLDFNKIIEKVNTFKGKNPTYAGYKYYLALAAMSFDKGVEKKCSNKGIAVFKPQGNSVVVSDKNLKTF